MGFHGYKEYPSGQRHALWDCTCKCGNKSVVLGMLLKKGATRSCGCHKHGGRRDNEYQFTNKGYVIGRPTNSDNLFYVDSEDFKTVKNHIWSERCGYMMTYINCKRVRMHRLIIGEENIPEDMVIDHINHNTRDNRRCNLRVVTKRQNSLNSRMQYNNTSGYPGVGLVDNNKWKATIVVNDKQITLGRYDTKEEAIRVRKAAEREYFGEFLNVYHDSTLSQVITPETDYIKLGGQNGQHLSDVI